MNYNILQEARAKTVISAADLTDSVMTEAYKSTSAGVCKGTRL